MDEHICSHVFSFKNSRLNSVLSTDSMYLCVHVCVWSERELKRKSEAACVSG